MLIFKSRNNVIILYAIILLAGLFHCGAYDTAPLTDSHMEHNNRSLSPSFANRIISTVSIYLGYQKQLSAPTVHRSRAGTHASILFANGNTIEPDDNETSDLGFGFYIVLPTDGLSEYSVGLPNNLSQILPLDRSLVILSTVLFLC